MRAWLLLFIVACAATAASLTQAYARSRGDVTRCERWIRDRPFHSKDRARALVLSADLACCDGEIEKDSVSPLLGWLSARRARDSRPLLVVRSGGGDAAVGIDIMEKLQKADVAVHVVDLCASSCANYFFAGAKHRSVTNGALLLFHGGYSEAAREAVISELQKLRDTGKAPPTFNFGEARDSILADLDRNMARQDALYARIGVNGAIVHNIDRVDVDALSDAQCDPTRSAPREFLFFTTPQLAEMGIRIRAGRPASTARDVNRKIKEAGGKFEACGLPDSAFHRFMRKPS